LPVLQPRAARQPIHKTAQDLLAPILRAGRFTQGPPPAKVSHAHPIPGHLREIPIADHRQIHPVTGLHPVLRLLTAPAAARPPTAVRATVHLADPAARPAIALRAGQTARPAIAGPAAAHPAPAGPAAAHPVTAGPAHQVRAIQGPAAVLHPAVVHPVVVQEAAPAALRVTAHHIPVPAVEAGDKVTLFKGMHSQQGL